MCYAKWPRGHSAVFTGPSAEELNERGRALSDAGDSHGALAAYRAAAKAAPSWSVPWYNLGLEHKYRGEWRESADCNREAVLRDDSDGDAWWNLGIAATALGAWRQAREAWARCGVSIPAGDGPIETNYGLTPIRLAPASRGEVVWCDRIDPARAIIRNIPLPESGRFYGDLVLHDGAPNGTRMRQGSEVPVFDELERLQRSAFRTYVLDVPGSTAAQREMLADLAFESGMAAEDWSQSIVFLCRSCSEGVIHERHDDDLRATRPELAAAAAAINEESLGELIDAWRQRAGYEGRVGWTLVGEDP